jgi:hypothetical protein
LLNTKFSNYSKVDETETEETPKVVEEAVVTKPDSEEPKEDTNGHTENGKETTEVENGEDKTENGKDKNGEDTIEEEKNGVDKAENGHEKTENGHSNGNSNGHTENGATKRKADDAGDAALEPIPVSAEKIAKLTETEEKVEEKEVEATT